FNWDLQHTTMNAIEALDYGEVQPLLKAVQGNRKRKLTELRLQLRALAFVEYRVGRGKKKYIAQDEVASALGVDRDTILSWGPRLRAEFGSLEVARTLAFAKNSGSNEEREQRQRHISGATDTLSSWEYRYGSQALGKLGKDYRAAQKK